MTGVLIAVFAVLIAVYGVFLYRDIRRHRDEFRAEKGAIPVIAAITFGIQFLSAMGISDFNVSIPLYRGLRLVDDKRLPGTLLCATAVPGAMIGIIYLSGAEVFLPTLICCLAAQSLGTVAGMRIVSKMKTAAVRRVMAAALIVSTVVVIARMLWFSPGDGELVGLPVWTTLCIAPVYFTFGAINMMGFGIKALSMSLLLSLGINPVTVLLIVLSACGISAWCGAMQYVASGAYQRKITAVSSMAGVFGALAGSFFVKELNTAVLQWVMVAIMVHAAVTMLRTKNAAQKSAG